MPNVILTPHQEFILEIIKVVAPYVVAILGIISGWLVPHLTKNIELEKHKQQFLFEKKYNAYSKYFKLFDDFWNLSYVTVGKIHLLNNNANFSEDEFNIFKQDVANTYREFSKIQRYLSMPSLEILIFVNSKIEDKIKDIVAIETSENGQINPSADFEENKKIIEQYINVLADLSKLLQEDLGIEIKEK